MQGLHKLHDHLKHNKDVYIYIYCTTMNINVKYFWYIFRSQVSAYPLRSTIIHYDNIISTILQLNTVI